VPYIGGTPENDHQKDVPLHNTYPYPTHIWALVVVSSCIYCDSVWKLMGRVFQSRCRPLWWLLVLGTHFRYESCMYDIKVGFHGFGCLVCHRSICLFYLMWFALSVYGFLLSVLAVESVVVLKIWIWCVSIHMSSFYFCNLVSGLLICARGVCGLLYPLGLSILPISVVFFCSYWVRLFVSSVFCTFLFILIYI
jgi:hypothetical protein